VADLLDSHGFGWQVGHGDVEGMVRTIEAAATTDPRTREAMGRRGKDLIERELSKARLCARFGDVVEFGAPAAGASPARPPGQPSPEPRPSVAVR
jgi:hypothetical protein